MNADSTHDLYEKIVLNSQMAIAIADASGSDCPLIYVNPAFERITGYTQDEVLGRNCRFLQNCDRDQPELARLRNAIADGKSVQVLLRNFRKDGSPFWNDLIVAPIRGESGQITHFFSFFSDVTSNVDSLQTQQRSPRWWSSLLDASMSLIVVCDAQGRVIFESAATASILGYPKGTMIGRDWATLIHQSGHAVVAQINREMQQGIRKSASVEFATRHADKYPANLPLDQFRP